MTTSTNWGSKDQPYYRPGPNPTVDLVVFRSGRHEPEVLLIRRAAHAATEPGKWALPGGFHDTPSPKGHIWIAGAESAEEAALRELQEETGLVLPPEKHSQLTQVGVYEGNNRDPRDNIIAWSRSTAFAINLGTAKTPKVRGQDDADKAAWLPLSKVPKLAFDHSVILTDSIQLLQIPTKPVLFER